MSDISVTIGQRETYQVSLGQGILPHGSSHAPGGSDSIEEYYYPRSNPSGYAQSGDFATVQYVDGVSGSLYSQISFPENVVFTTGGQTINGAKNFSTRPTVNGSGVLIVGEITAVETGYLTGYVSKEETGVYSTVFYPRNNPSGYITGVDLSNYQTVVSSTGISGYLQAQIIVLNGQTGSYALAINTGSFLTAGAADNRYVNVLGDTVSGNLVVTGSTSGQSFVLKQSGSIDFQGGVPTHREGRIFYDTDAHTLCYFNDEADVTVNVGQENIVRVSNGWTGTLLNGRVVYASGAHGNRPKVFPASASDSNVSRHDVLGVATHDISDQGYITTAGLVNGLNTTGFLEGDTVYLSMETGLFSAQMPVAPNHAIKIGIITRSHQTQGQLFVDIDQGAHLNHLHDVRITGVQNNDLFRYNSTSGYWENFQSDFVTGDVVRPSETGSFLTGEIDPIFAASTAYFINSTLTGQWGESYRDSITGIGVEGSSSKTITLYQRDGATLTANFTDIEGTGDGGTDYFLTGASFDSANGNLSLYVNDGSVITESLDGRYVTGSVVRPNETGDFLISSSLNSYQTIAGSTGISGYLQGQINSIDLSSTGSFLTTGAGDGRYYPLSSNPSNYLVAADISSLASTDYVTGVSGHLQSQITEIISGTGSFITGVDLSAYQTVIASTGVSGYLQAQINAIDLSNLESATGNLNVRVSAIENVSGDFALKANTGAFLTTGAADSRYYPLSSNPSSYLVASDISHLASTGYVTGISGHLQVQITAINNETGNFITSSQTGQFYPINNPSGYITGVDLSNYATVPFVTGVSGYLQSQVSANYDSSITGVSVAGSDTKTVTLYQRDGGTLSANFTDLQSTGESSSISHQEIYIDAGAMTTGISGASPTGVYIGSADVSFDVYSFGAGANSFSQFKMVLPSNWSTGDMKAKFHWTALNGSTGHVRWGIQSRAVGNDDAISGAWGTSQEVVSQFITGFDNHVTTATSQISFSNSALPEDSLYFRVVRNADHATDTFGLSSYLKGVSIQYKVSGTITQW